jgi:hypothetical protein
VSAVRKSVALLKVVAPQQQQQNKLEALKQNQSLIGHIKDQNLRKNEIE